MVRRLLPALLALTAALGGCAQASHSVPALAGTGPADAAPGHEVAWDSAALRGNLSVVLDVDVAGPAACTFGLSLSGASALGPYQFAAIEFRQAGNSAVAWAAQRVEPAVHALGLDTRASVRSDGAISALHVSLAAPVVSGRVTITLADRGAQPLPGNETPAMQASVRCDHSVHAEGVLGGREVVLFDQASGSGGVGAVIGQPADVSVAAGVTVDGAFTAPLVHVLAASGQGAGLLTFDCPDGRDAFALPAPSAVSSVHQGGGCTATLDRAGAVLDSFVGAMLGVAPAAGLGNLRAD